MKLGLGTAQFGFDYGLTNSRGKVPVSEAKKILTFAASSDISVLDTAALYEESESVIGQCLPEDSLFQIVTKTPQLGGESVSALPKDEVLQTFYRSLDRLGRSSIYGLLFHSAGDLLAQGGGQLFEACEALKAKGLIKKIGVSVYSAAQIEKIISRFPIGLIQLPINVFDQRLLNTGLLTEVKRRGIEIHARSLFLQGLLLMEPENIPSYFETAKDLFKNYHMFLKAHHLTLLEGALGFVRQIAEIDHLIVGVCSVRELEEILKAYQKMSNCALDYRPYSCQDEKIVNPSLWKVERR